MFVLVATHFHYIDINTFLILISKEQRKSYRFGMMTINDDIILVFGYIFLLMLWRGCKDLGTYASVIVESAVCVHW